MKKLLLLINIACFYFLIASCQNTQKANSETSESKSMIQDSALANDTAKTKMQTSNSGCVGLGQGTKKDSTKISTTNTAIIHGAPDQAKIDSIKKAKLKGKK